MSDLDQLLRALQEFDRKDGNPTGSNAVGGAGVVSQLLRQSQTALEPLWSADPSDTVRMVAAGYSPTAETELAQPQAADENAIAGMLRSVREVVKGLADANVRSELVRTPFNVAGERITPAGGLAGVLGGLFSLIRGHAASDGTPVPQELPYSFAEPRDVKAAVGNDPARGYAYDHQFDGRPRRMDSENAPAPRVEIHVQALDARSILDRKEDLAEAVRQAVSASGAGRNSVFGY